MAQLILTIALLFVVYYIGYAIGRKEIVDEVKRMIDERPCERCDHYINYGNLTGCEKWTCEFKPKENKERADNERDRF